MCTTANTEWPSTCALENSLHDRQVFLKNIRKQTTTTEGHFILKFCKKAIFLRTKDYIWLRKFIKLILNWPHFFIVVEVFFPQWLIVYTTTSLRSSELKWQFKKKNTLKNGWFFLTLNIICLYRLLQWS